MKSLTAILIALPLLLSGCDASNSPSSKSSPTESAITGLVLDDDTPITQGKIEAADRNGKVIASATINGDAHYRLKLPAGSAFPVVLTASPEGETRTLKAAVTSDLVSEQDISSVTTIVVETAMNLGGLTETNLAKAAGAAISQRRSSGGSGGSAGFKGDPTKQYGGWH